MEEQSCLLKIQSRRKFLTAGESKVADYVIENYNDIVDLNVTELADKANSSDATVVRFCKNIGYKGYQDFKINLARAVMASPYKHINPELEPEDKIADIVKKVFNSEVSVLQETLNLMNYSDMEKAADFILNAAHVELYGCGASSIIGKDIQHKFLKIGIKCFVNSDNDIQAMAASLLSKGDVAIGISHSGANKDVVHCMKLAKEFGATTIALTAQYKSPLSKCCDIVLMTAAKQTAFKSESLSVRIAQLAVMDSLMTSIAFKNYEKSYEAIQRTRNATATRKY